MSRYQKLRTGIEKRMAEDDNITSLDLREYVYVLLDSAGRMDALLGKIAEIMGKIDKTGSDMQRLTQDLVDCGVV